MKLTENYSLEELAEKMGVTVDSLAKIPLSKVIAVFDNFREGKVRLYKFDCDVIAYDLKRI